MGIRARIAACNPRSVTLPNRELGAGGDVEVNAARLCLLDLGTFSSKEKPDYDETVFYGSTTGNPTFTFADSQYSSTRDCMLASTIAASRAGTTRQISDETKKRQ